MMDNVKNINLYGRARAIRLSQLVRPNFPSRELYGRYEYAVLARGIVIVAHFQTLG